MKTYLAIALIATGSPAGAHGGVKDANVMNRMMGMSKLAKQMKVIGAMAKGEATFDAAVVNRALTRMFKEASHIPSLFETRAIGPKSEALPVIWDDFDTFTARAQELEQLAGDLADTVETSADLGPVVVQVGQACSACHSVFRK